MADDHQSHEGNTPKPIFNWILVGFFLVAGYFLVMEHRAHLSGILYYLPVLLLLACPLMHLFMHHGHGGHGEHSSQKDNRGEQK
ncbi:MAG: DUF2933 domain-containing protein [Sterolibacterium sp.]|jgi:hypothetical protein